MGTLAIPFLVTALRSRTPSFPVTGQVHGYASASDGGGGVFRYDPSSALADDGGTVLRPSSGAWLRIDGGPLNVQWFGAVGDGVTDDAAAIRAAIAAAVVGRTTSDVYLPAGTYLIGSTVNVPAGVTVKGAGASTIIKASAGVTGSALTLSGELRNLTVDGLASTGVVHGIIVAPVDVAAQPILERVTAQNFKGTGAAGLKVVSAVGMLATACYFAGNTIGVHTDGTSTPTISTFLNCFFQSCTTYGLRMDTGWSCSFLGCTFEGNGNSGVFLNGASVVDAHFVGCWFELNNTGAGTYQFLATNCRFTLRDTFFAGLSKNVSLTATCVFVMDNVQLDYNACAGAVSIADSAEGYLANACFSLANGAASVYSITSANVIGEVTPNTKGAVSGAKSGNAALASLIAALVAQGLITDGTT